MFLCFLLVVNMAGVESIDHGPYFKTKYQCQNYVEIIMADHNQIIGGYCDYKEI